MRIAFWGAGRHDPRKAGDPHNDGNRWYSQNILQVLQNNTDFQMDRDTFAYNEEFAALRRILRFIDHDANHFITSEEATGSVIRIVGYSWGGMTALAVAQRLNRTGYLRVGGTPGRPEQYHLDRPVRLETLVLIDPVPILNWPTDALPSNVRSFRNYYQCLDLSAPPWSHNRKGRAGDDAISGSWDRFTDHSTPRYHGVPIRNAPSGSQTNVTLDCPDRFVLVPVPNRGNQLFGLYGPEVNHATIPLYVSNWVVPLME